MPILAKETEIYPENLFDTVDFSEDRKWWAIYTMSRREKELMRRLVKQQIACYCPIIPHRQRSPAGRMRESYLPLFTNYIFLYGDDEARYNAIATNCVSKCVPVIDGPQLTTDLAQLYSLVAANVPLTIESKLHAGQYVRVKTGAFRGYEGTIVRREGERRLLVHVNFLEQGASLILDDCEVEAA